MLRYEEALIRRGAGGSGSAHRAERGAPRQPRLLLDAVCQIKVIMPAQAACGTDGCVSKTAAHPFVSALPDFLSWRHVSQRYLLERDFSYDTIPLHQIVSPFSNILPHRGLCGPCISCLHGHSKPCVQEMSLAKMSPKCPRNGKMVAECLQAGLS